MFASFNEELFKEITHLLTLENFRYLFESFAPYCVSVSLIYFPDIVSASLVVNRENEQLSKYGDTKSARAIMLLELKKLIEANPLFREKLQFPNLKSSRLRTLINQR